MTLLRTAVAAQVGSSITIVHEPGPKTLRLRTFLFRVSASSIVRTGGALRTTISPYDLSEAEISADILDSKDKEIVATVSWTNIALPAQASYQTGFTSWSFIRASFEAWAKNVDETLNATPSLSSLQKIASR